MITTDQLGTIAGATMKDQSGTKIGKVVDVYESTDGPQATFVTVSTGMFGGSNSFVPLAEATVQGEDVVVPYSMAIGAHLVGAATLLRSEQDRIRRQDGVARSTAVKTALTAAALGTTAYSGVLNRKMASAGHAPVTGATEPGPQTPPDIAKTQKQLKAVQWLIPGLTGSMVAATAWQSEQMRPQQALQGSLPSLPALPSGLPKLAGAGAAVLLLTKVLRARKAKARELEPADTAPPTSPATSPTTGPVSSPAVPSSSPPPVRDTDPTATKAATGLTDPDAIVVTPRGTTSR